MTSTTPMSEFFLKLAQEAAAFAPDKAAPAPAATKASGTLARATRPAEKPPLTHWEEVSVPRFPYVPKAVQASIEQWIRELDAARELIEAGERVLPLLLDGESRCGKTSIANVIGRARNLRAYRMNLANAVSKYMGETAKTLDGALREATSRPGLWLIDEIDAVAFKRGTGTSAASIDLSHSVGALLTKIEQLPPDLALIGTTNHIAAIDPAVLGRFTCVKWPRWEQLAAEEKRGFLDAQEGHAVPEAEPTSYADAVKLARAERVEAILSGRGKQLGLGGVS